MFVLSGRPAFLAVEHPAPHGLGKVGAEGGFARGSYYEKIQMPPLPPAFLARTTFNVRDTIGVAFFKKEFMKSIYLFVANVASKGVEVPMVDLDFGRDRIIWLGR
jgi:hypothetical protein